MDNKYGEKPLVSIIIPVYNVEKYIQTCLESMVTVIRKSAYENEIEIICVDDGSNDESGKICDSYALKYKNIRVYHNENQGVSRARAFGLSNANGIYVAWCDADDYFAECWYENVVNILKNNDIDGVVIGYVKKYKDKEKNFCCSIRGIQSQQEYIYLLSADDKIKSYLYIHIIKKDILDKCDIDFSLKTYEDYDLLTKVSMLIDKIYIVNKSLYYYVFRESSITNTSKPNDLFKAISVAKKRSYTYQSKSIIYSDAGYWKTLMIYCVKSACDKHESRRYQQCKRELRELMINIIFAKELNFKYKVCLLLLVVFPRRFIGYMWNALKGNLRCM
ncbi:glycosyltransferase family 2 protein [Selenomonas ruminantium]|uniref:Glycosyl transferase family 2 n=1 Tax=Selenomonas ruminantium TaxID=971 RepID=A0A1H0TYS6_SELRU|nr:glycosyltransferase [Selenomonas ruminantium]SDP58838.1 Glycosyl transferase family 2 [Selenomonas ruminantium]